ncbi:MAG: hypothetical protein N2690_02955 [Rhodocyclaceae bacterium]|nr:hypothetical protein [Rhodocyclaceae bacterium]
MKITLLGVVFLLSANAWAQEEPIQRSSHPRGFASGAPLPAMVSPGGKTPSGSTATGGAAAASPSANQAAQQGSSGGVNLTGNTRIDARAQGATAAAAGQQNAAGNRVGAIGGQQIRPERHGSVREGLPRANAPRAGGRKPHGPHHADAPRFRA